MSEWGRPAPEGLTDAPAELAEAARLHLREKFLRAKVGVSGANFMVAETGTLVVVESEGNGRMCLTLPETLISVVGIEKTVPTWRDLEVFLQTLPRSSTAERMNPYTSMWTGTTDEDGPRNFHLVLLDNGRTDALSDEVGRQALRCIRCSACLNVCPVYERAGGHAYGSVYPGPIGAILSPQLRGTGSEIDASLPYASSLCGACYEVCPVAIDIPEVLVHLRERVAQGGEVTRNGNKVVLKPAKGHAAERAAMRAARWAFARPGALRTGQRLASRTRRLHPRTLPGPGRAWSYCAVASTLTVNVRQRAAELELLRCSGATPAQLKRMVVGEAAVVALVGAALAVVPAVLGGRLLLEVFRDSGQVAGSVDYSFGVIALMSGIDITLLASAGAAFLALRRATRGRRRHGRARSFLAYGALAAGTAAVCSTFAFSATDGALMAPPAYGAILLSVGLALMAPRLLEGVLGRLAPGGASGWLAVRNLRQRAGDLAGILMSSWAW
ncbi:Lactate utilization protein B [Streptomyces griseomycini]